MEQNQMSYVKISKLIWKIGFPMILSMILQAVYNVVDTIFVINSSAATLGNEALTAAFPIQILIIAIGVGTGVGINALLSKCLGEGKHDFVTKIVGNGIFLALIIYIAFLLFGIFGAEAYMHLMSNNETVVEYGTMYLRICCCFSLGSIGYTVYERFLQSTGKSTQSMIAQMSGAIANIGLDALFILVFNWGVAGAAWATIIGQFLSLFVAMFFHYYSNKEIKNKFSAIKPSWNIIKGIYKIGLPAAIMQGLLAAMMFIILLIINTIDDGIDRSLMTNAFGIYYKIMQIGLFACFGLSNTLITIVSFNYGMKNKERVYSTIKWGIIDSIITAIVVTILFQIFANPIAEMFGMSLEEVSSTGILKQDVINTVVLAIHIATIGYVFMGISVGIQGILQGFRNVMKPVIISLLRLIVFVIPLAFIFTKNSAVISLFWWTFPITEVLTAAISLFLLKVTIKKLKFDIE